MTRPEHRATLASRHNLAVVYGATGDFWRAAELFERTLADFERVLGPGNPDTLICREDLRQARTAAGLDDGQDA